MSPADQFVALAVNIGLFGTIGAPLLALLVLVLKTR